jgi:predicted transposase/invertase (TIGR01784 family)
MLTYNLLNPFNEKDTADDKLSILDIKARDQRGRQYNVEMQMLAPRVYPQRVLYYWFLGSVKGPTRPNQFRLGLP